MTEKLFEQVQNGPLPQHVCLRSASNLISDAQVCKDERGYYLKTKLKPQPIGISEAVLLGRWLVTVDEADEIIHEREKDEYYRKYKKSGEEIK